MMTIHRNRQKQKIDDGDNMTLIDLLPGESFDHFHLPGAINIPMGPDMFEKRVRAAAGKDDWRAADLPVE